MKSKIPAVVHKTIRIVFLSSIVLSVLLMIGAFLAGYELGSNYFKLGTPLPILSVVFAAIAALLGTADAFLIDAPSVMQKDAIKIAPLFAAIGFVFAGIAFAISASSSLAMISAILLVIACFHSILAFINKNELKLLTFYLGFAAVIGCGMLSILFYFDMTLEMNAPIKIMPQFALLFAMLYYTSELRCLIDRHAHRAYRILCAWTTTACTVSSIPLIIAYAIGRITREDVLYAAILLLCIAITALLRLLSIYRADNTDTDPQ